MDNLDECICDIGPFTTCPACESQINEPRLISTTRHEKSLADLTPIEDYIALVKMGRHWGLR